MMADFGWYVVWLLFCFAHSFYSSIYYWSEVAESTLIKLIWGTLLLLCYISEANIAPLHYNYLKPLVTLSIISKYTLKVIYKEGHVL